MNGVISSSMGKDEAPPVSPSANNLETMHQSQQIGSAPKMVSPETVVKQRNEVSKSTADDDGAAVVTLDSSDEDSDEVMVIGGIKDDEDPGEHPEQDYNEDYGAMGGIKSDDEEDGTESQALTTLATVNHVRNSTTARETSTDANKPVVESVEATQPPNVQPRKQQDLPATQEAHDSGGKGPEEEKGNLQTTTSEPKKLPLEDGDNFYRGFNRKITFQKPEKKVSSTLRFPLNSVLREITNSLLIFHEALTFMKPVLRSKHPKYRQILESLVYSTLVYVNCQRNWFTGQIKSLWI